MDWETYKRLSDQPQFWSNWMLAQCIELLEQIVQSPAGRERTESLGTRSVRLEALVSALRDALDRPHLATPPDYKGPLRMHELNLSVDDAKLLYDSVLLADAQGLVTAATAERGLGGFVEVARDYHAAVAADVVPDHTAGSHRT